MEQVLKTKCHSRVERLVEQILAEYYSVHFVEQVLKTQCYNKVERPMEKIQTKCYNFLEHFIKLEVEQVLQYRDVIKL